MSTAAMAATNMPSTLRPRHVKHVSNPAPKLSPLQLCSPLPATSEALDLSRVSPTQTLASLRFLVLSHLADLERHLSQLESPDLKIEEARTWAETGLDMLDNIRADVRAHLPDIHFSDLTSVESFLRAHIPELPTLVDMCSRLPDMPDVRSHLPELPHLPDMAGVCSHFPEIPHIPDMQGVRARLPDFTDMCSRFDDIRLHFQEIDSRKLFGYVPTLSMHLQNLHSHLSSTEAEFAKVLGVPSLPPSSLLRHVLEALTSSELMMKINPLGTEAEEETTEHIEKDTCQVTKAIKRSVEGIHLITYHDLPEPWKNNQFVTQGYRFIPIDRWPLLIKSVFTFHNETLNIHTHLIPLILYFINIISVTRDSAHIEAAEVLYLSFACVCLLGSIIWHTMAGCAHHASMELFARIDYVGIGWLISASVGTVVHYGYQCHPKIGHAFQALCFVMGLVGNILPFMDWFNQTKYRFHRIIFFLALAFSAFAPLCGMVILHSRREMSEFIVPILPSITSYVIGLIFYACHWPERHLPKEIQGYLDRFGGNSHAIWHCFIILGVIRHKQGMQLMKDGFQCLTEYTTG